MKKKSNHQTIPSYAILRSFESAARHESFTLASEELHLTQSAISRQVKDLEIMLGIKLFKRVGRRVTLTEAGRNFSIDVAADMERMRQTIVRTIAAGAHGSSLRIAVLPTFSTRWLIPRLPLFIKDNPDLELNLETKLEPFDLSEERFDLAIHYGAMDWPNTKMTKICDEVLYATCSPNLRDKFDISTLEMLAQSPLLHLNSRPMAWADWFEKKGYEEKTVFAGKHFDQFSMIIAAAKASIGVGLLPTFLVEKEIEQERLIRLSETSFTTNKAYYIVSPHGGENRNVQNFTNWIKSQVSKK